MILSTTINLLGKELKGFINIQLPLGSGSISVLVDNIEQSNDGGTPQSEGVILSLIRIEEERALNNPSTARRAQNLSHITYRRPDLHLNLYLLVSTNFSQYDNALIALSYALEFFQSKPVFKAQNLQFPELLSHLNAQQQADFFLSVELHSLSYEQTNYLWSTFGGKQSPHFVLKARLVQISPQQTQDQGAVIQELQSKEVIN